MAIALQYFSKDEILRIFKKIDLLRAIVDRSVEFKAFTHFPVGDAIRVHGYYMVQ